MVARSASSARAIRAPAKRWVHWLCVSGGSTIQQVPSGTGTTSLVFTNGQAFLTRGFGATLEYLTPGVIGSTSQVILQGSMPTGFIGGWATVNDSSFAAFITLVPATGVYIGTFSGESSTFAPNAYVNPTAATSVVGQLTINTLNLDCSSIAKTVTQISGTTLTFATGGLLKWGSNSGTINGGVITSNGEIDATVSGVLNLNSKIADNGSTAVSLIKAGSGTLVLGAGAGDTNVNTYSGITEVHGGTLDLNKDPGTNAVPGDLLIDGGAVILHQDEQISDLSNATLTVGTFNLNGHVETINSLTNSGGTLLTGGGTLIVNSPHTTVLSGGTTTVNSGGSLNSVGMLVSGGLNTVQSNGVINVGAAGLTFALTQSPAIILNADAAKPAKMTLNGDVTFSGTDGTAYIKTSAVASGQSPGVLDLGGTTRTFTINDGGASVDMEISAAITNGALVKSGRGLLRLTATNSYAGGTTLSDGTLEILNTLGVGTGPVTFAGGFLSLKSDSVQTNYSFPIAADPTRSLTLSIDRAFTRSTTGEFDLGIATLGTALNITGASGGLAVFSGLVLGAGSVNINNSVAVNTDFIAQTASSAGLLKTGAGTLTLLGSFGNYTFTGPMSVNAGLVALKNTGGSAIQSSLAVNGSATVQLLAENQTNPNSAVTLNGAIGTALFDLNGFGDSIGSLSFIAGGIVTTGIGTLTTAAPITFIGAAGSGSLSGNLAWTGTQTFTVADGSAADDLVIAANLYGTAITKSGPGTLAFTSLSPGANALAITISQGRVHLRPAGSAPVVNKVTGLTITGTNDHWNGSLDLDNNVLLIDYGSSSPIQAVQNQVKNGYANGAWNGPGINSTAASATGLHRMAVGFAEAASLGVGSFLGQPVDNTTLILRTTFSGDANLDGVVSTADFAMMAGSFGKSSQFWTSGDFNYDGVINSLDFNAIATNFGQSMSSPSLDPAPDAPALGNVVPEPMALAMLTVFGFAGVRRRRGLGR